MDVSPAYTILCTPHIIWCCVLMFISQSKSARWHHFHCEEIKLISIMHSCSKLMHLTTTHDWYIPTTYLVSYCIAEKFGGDFNLAIWWFCIYTNSNQFLIFSLTILVEERQTWYCTLFSHSLTEAPYICENVMGLNATFYSVHFYLHCLCTIFWAY